MIIQRKEPDSNMIAKQTKNKPFAKFKTNTQELLKELQRFNLSWLMAYPFGG